MANPNPGTPATRQIRDWPLEQRMSIAMMFGETTLTKEDVARIWHELYDPDNLEPSLNGKRLRDEFKGGQSAPKNGRPKVWADQIFKKKNHFTQAEINLRARLRVHIRAAAGRVGVAIAATALNADDGRATDVSTSTTNVAAPNAGQPTATTTAPASVQPTTVQQTATPQAFTQLAAAQPTTTNATLPPPTTAATTVPASVQPTAVQPTATPQAFTQLAAAQPTTVNATVPPPIAAATAPAPVQPTTVQPTATAQAFTQLSAAQQAHQNWYVPTQPAWHLLGYNQVYAGYDELLPGSPAYDTDAWHTAYFNTHGVHFR